MTKKAIFRIVTIVVLIYLATSIIVNIKTGNFKHQKAEIQINNRNLMSAAEEKVEFDSSLQVIFEKTCNAKNLDLMLTDVYETPVYKRFNYYIANAVITNNIASMDTNNTRLQYTSDTSKIFILFSRNNNFVVRILQDDSLSLRAGSDYVFIDSAMAAEKFTSLLN